MYDLAAVIAPANRYTDQVLAGRFNYQMLLDYLHDNEELAKAFPRATKGKKGQAPPPQNIYDVSNSVKILGYKPTSAESTA